MSNQLKALVALQDLDLMIREAKDPKHATHEEELGFAMSGMDKLERTRERLAKQIDENLLDRDFGFSNRAHKLKLSQVKVD